MFVCIVLKCAFVTQFHAALGHRCKAVLCTINLNGYDQRDFLG